MNAENQNEVAASPDARQDDVFEFGERTIFTLRHQELELEEPGSAAIRRETVAAIPLPPPAGDETMVMSGAAMAAAAAQLHDSGMLAPSTDPGDRTIVAVPPMLPIAADAALSDGAADDRLARLEQKLDAATRLMLTMQHRLDSIDAALARIIHR